MKQQLTLQRTNSSNMNRNNTRKIAPSNPNYLLRSSSSSSSSTSNALNTIPEHDHHDVSRKLLLFQRTSAPTMSHNSLSSSSSSTNIQTLSKVNARFASLLRSLVRIVSIPHIIIPSCKWLSLPVSNLSITSPALGRKVTVTLFGFRRGHVCFAVHDDPRSEPVLLLELAISTSMLVREMSSGLVRIALECEKMNSGPVQHGSYRKRNRVGNLFSEPKWMMYCNGRKCGYAVSRACTELDLHVLNTVRTVSIGAGVIPVVDDGREASSEGELLYMRAKFERVVGSRHSEAFYMMNPDGNGGPELSIFLLRI